MSGYGSKGSVTMVLALAAVVLWGCGGGEGADAGGEAGAESGDRSALSASLQAVNESGMAGNLRIDPAGDSVTVKLEVLGVQSGETYQVLLHRGGCAETGEEIADVGAPTVATVGLGSSLLRLPPSGFPAEGLVSVRVYLPDGTEAACAEVRSPRS